MSTAEGSMPRASSWVASGEERTMSVSVKFAWYDFWIGAYWDRKAHVLYVCPLPMFLITVRP
jgi:hypothetical protein